MLGFFATWALSASILHHHRRSTTVPDGSTTVTTATTTPELGQFSPNVSNEPAFPSQVPQAFTPTRFRHMGTQATWWTINRVIRGPSSLIRRGWCRLPRLQSVRLHLVLFLLSSFSMLLRLLLSHFFLHIGHGISSIQWCSCCRRYPDSHASFCLWPVPIQRAVRTSMTQPSRSC